MCAPINVPSNFLYCVCAKILLCATDRELQEDDQKIIKKSSHRMVGKFQGDDQKKAGSVQEFEGDVNRKKKQNKLT